MRYTDVYVDVISGDNLDSKYLGTVPDDIFQKFTKRSKASLNAYIAKWAWDDWSISIPMTHIKHYQKLREVILRVSKQNYLELYTIEGVYIEDIFWVNLWLASHMLQEVI